MMTKTVENPFHHGERAAQERAGVGDVAQWAGGFIRDHLPEQHRAFHTALPFLVVAGGDPEGRTWVSVIEGSDGFVTSPDPRHLHLATEVPQADPLHSRFAAGGQIGAVGIDLATRRRNRFSGSVSAQAGGYLIAMAQTFGNCPQYIHERSLARVPNRPLAPRRSNKLTPAQIDRIHAADTLFIGSGHHVSKPRASNGYDASHRGGAPGFVRVTSPTQLQIPDYMGNNFFNTIGNIMADPRVGLVFVDFETGGLLHLSGRATVDWSPVGAHDPDAWRMITVEIETVLDRPAALSLRWARLDHRRRRLRLERRQQQSDTVTAFYFAPADGRALEPFSPGQHLPITLRIAGQTAPVSRSYSLSGAPTDPLYRLSVKREPQGLMSRALHDRLQIGDVIEAQSPTGEFTADDGGKSSVLVLVSAGVGLTPLLSLLHGAAASGRPAWFIHGARNGRSHAHRAEIAGLVASHPHLRQRLFYSQPDPGDVPGRDFDVAGRVTVQDVLDLPAGPDARYMLCGPTGFVAELRQGLEDAGVPPEHIRFETFGPAPGGSAK